MTTAKRNTHPFWLVTLAVIALLGDAGVSAYAIYLVISVSGSAGTALAFSIFLSILLFLIAFSMFMKGLELSQQPHSAKRSISLGGLIGLIVSYMMLSLSFNGWAIGGGAMKADWISSKVEATSQSLNSINKLFSLPEDEKATLQSIAQTSEKWRTCERSVGCVGRKGGGSGQVTITLDNYLNVTNSAIAELQSLSSQYEPLLEEINDIIDHIKFIDSMEHLSFEAKLIKTGEQVQELIALTEMLQSLLPVRVFAMLGKEFDQSVNQYEAQGISTQGARMLFNYYDKWGKHYRSVARDLERGSYIHINPLTKPTDIEVMTSSSNALMIWMVAGVLAFSTWLMLGIHIVQNTRLSKHDEEKETTTVSQLPSSIPSVSQSEIDLMIKALKTPKTSH